MILRMADTEALYRAIGQKIRERREQTAPKLSQDKLAKQLGISRASVVNIEAGRQHAPLHLLWQIAEALETDLAMLIPRRAELHSTETVIELNKTMRKQIELEANGDPNLEKGLTNIVGRLLATIETDTTRDKP